jgi:ATP-dependent Lon protease
MSGKSNNNNDNPTRQTRRKTKNDGIIHDDNVDDENNKKNKPTEDDNVPIFKRKPRRKPTEEIPQNENNKNNNTNNNKKRRRLDDNKQPIIFIRRVPFVPPTSIHSGNEKGGCSHGPRIPLTKSQQIKQNILNSKMDPKVKEEALNRLKNLDSDKPKQMEWFDQLLKIPFGEFSPLPVTKEDPKSVIYEYFKQCQQKLDEAVYGLDTVKEEIINYIAQFVATDSKTMPRIIALQGSAGTGKTSLIRRGLADALGRPMKTISMGGIRDSSHFSGFDYTYSGSRHGIILQSLMDSHVMNPIIFMDELDKISQNHDGIEVQNLLIHLTDPMQNSTFHDKFFAGIDFDLSRVIFIFAFNEESLINPILKDRLHVIRIPDPDINAKVVIGKQFLTKELSKNLSLQPTDIQFDDEVMKYIIQNFCNEDKGVRGIKRCIESIYLKINTAQYTGDLCKYKTIKNKSFPIQVTKDMVNELIQKSENKDEKYIHSMYL